MSSSESNDDTQEIPTKHNETIKDPIYERKSLKSCRCSCGKPPHQPKLSQLVPLDETHSLLQEQDQTSKTTFIESVLSDADCASILI